MNEQRTNAMVPVFPVILAVGSEARETLAKLIDVARLLGHPIEQGVNAWFHAIDTHLAPARAGVEGMAVNELSRVFIESKLPDRESLRQMHDDGTLWFLKRELVEDPGARADGLGTGNHPAWGRADVQTNRLSITKAVRQALRASHDHRRRLEEAMRHGDGKAGEPVPVVVIASAIGGEGSGAAPELLTLVHEEAKQLGLQIKPVLVVIDLGSIPPPDRQLATRNRRHLFNVLRAQLSGVFHGLEGGEGPVQDSVHPTVVLSSNIAEESELSTLDEQESQLALWLFYSFCTPLGSRWREDLVDLEENRGVDPWGVECAGAAFGLWTGGLDRGRVSQHLSAELGAALARTILSASSGRASDEGHSAAGELSLLESEAEDQAVRFLTGAKETEPDAFEEVVGAFRNRFQGLSGWRGLQAVHESYRTVMANLIPQVIVPRLRGRCPELLASAQERLAKEEESRSKQLSGLNSQSAWVQELIRTLKGCDRWVSERLELVRQVDEGVLEELSGCQERLNSLARRSSLGRWLRILTTRHTFRRYREAGERALRLEIELASLRLLHGEVYLPLIGMLRGEVAELKKKEARLDEVRQELERQAGRLLSAPACPLRFSVGVDLADRRFLEGFWRSQLAGKGGIEKLTGTVFGAVLEKERSLFRLLEHTPEELQAILTSHAGEPFRSDVEAIDVLHELLERYKGEQLAALISRAVKEARPRIRTSGEAQQDIRCSKLIGVPAGADPEPLRKLANEIDRTPGEWKIVILHDLREAVIFNSSRSSVSLTMLLDGHDGSAAVAPSERIQASGYPMASLLPAGKITREDAMVAAVHAAATGLLCHTDTDGYTLELQDGNPRPLGKTPMEVLSGLQKSFPNIAKCYTAMGRAFREDERGLRSRLLALKHPLNSSRPQMLGTLFDEAAVARALAEVDAVAPYLQNLVQAERYRRGEVR